MHVDISCEAVIATELAVYFFTVTDTFVCITVLTKSKLIIRITMTFVPYDTKCEILDYW